MFSITRTAIRAAAIAAFTVIISFVAINTAAAQDQQRQDRRQEQRQNGEPGKFDFYVLALSWSPSFCEAAKERAPDRTPQQQCSSRPYHFVVHGLWPQYERGFPRDCQIPAPRLNRDIVSSMLDLMPSPRLVFNEWDRHGTCSGLGQQGYFDAVRKSYDATKIPEKFLNITNYTMVTPDEVEDAFIKANPGLSRAAIAVTCDTRRLSEVRICLTKNLQFRDCPEIDRRACRRDKIVMPPVRSSS